MDPLQASLVGGGAFLAGSMNALAGGGTFFSFPALLAAGVPPVTANASNAVALWPASISSAYAYRRELARHKPWVKQLTVVAFLGGLAGGLLLLATSNATFAKLIPWLLLAATALFAFSSQVSRLVRWTRRRFGVATVDRKGRSGVGGALFQFAVSTYGGFFGAGQGIMMIAALSIQGLEDMQELNAIKNCLSAVSYTVSGVTFIVAGAISWPHTLLMLATALAGGYAGAAFARRLPARWLRRLVVGVGATLTAIYFTKTYF